MWYVDISRSQLEEMALKGLVSNRIIAWRIMLNILTGSHDQQIQQSWQMREAYYAKKQSLEPKASSNLDPKIFNPLSQDSKVKIN